jgi:CBS domain-containing protein
MVTLRDLVGRTGATAGGIMTSPAATISADAPIADAGRRLAETGRHRLVVVDAEKRAIGIVSAVDIVRGLLGLPVATPRGPFPHLDEATHLTWTDDAPLDLAHLDAVPDGPGLLQLVHGGAGLPERVVWVESCENLYCAPHGHPRDAAGGRGPCSPGGSPSPDMRFRTAAAADPGGGARPSSYSAPERDHVRLGAAV